jgi:ribosome recycling factor
VVVLEELLDEAMAKMDQAVAHTGGEFGTVRTGRANPGLLHRIQVDYYGALTPLQQLAGFSVPEARMLIVSPYDKSSITAIERAIRESDLGLNPSNDGNVIRLAFPALTEERRKELIRVVRHLAEEEGRPGGIGRRHLGRRHPARREGAPGDDRCPRQTCRRAPPPQGGGADGSVSRRGRRAPRRQGP